MKKTKFYDTCSLLLDVDNLFQREENIVISSITLSELENIKTASNKDPDVKYSARKVVQKLNDHYGEYTIVIYNPDFWHYFENKNVPVSNDSNILACALAYQIAHNDEDFSFVTNDLCLKHIARTFINNVESIEEDKIDDYPGYKDVSLTDEELAEFYQTNPTEKNIFDMKVGEYLILRDKDNEIIDLRKWVDGGYAFLTTNGFNSNWFGKVNPYKSDVYQKLLFDSLHTNQITMVKGPAGTGKSYISLAYLMTCLERGKIDKIIIFCNTVATANSAKLGFYPGTRLEKLLDSQIGNFLTGKFGGAEGVQQLISDNKLELLPLSDIRGYDTTGMKAGIYITEAQNLDRSLMKLALQRVGEDCICIIDGDNKQQVDLKAYEGANNGMRCASRAFRGQDIYGEVELKNIYRSRIAQIAENM